jgi:Flp pilus assembly protein TadB
VSHERARRRAEREARQAVEQTAAEEAAAAERARREREQQRAARRQAVAATVPHPSRPPRAARPRGVLEARRRRRWRVTVGVVLLVQVVTWVLSDSWWLRLAVLGLSVLFAPVVVVLLSDRRS